MLLQIIITLYILIYQLENYDNNGKYTVCSFITLQIQLNGANKEKSIANIETRWDSQKYQTGPIAMPCLAIQT